MIDAMIEVAKANDAARAMLFTKSCGPWAWLDDGRPVPHWTSTRQRYGIWEMDADHRGETPPIYWVGIINDPTGHDRKNGITFLPDARGFHAAAVVARTHAATAGHV